MGEKLEQMMLLQQYPVTNTAVEKEFFVDNNKRLKQQQGVVAKGLKIEEEGNEFLAEVNPKL